MGVVKEAVKAVLEWIFDHLSFRYFSMFFVLSLIFLLGINPLLQYFGLPVIPPVYRVITACIALLAFAGTCFTSIEMGWKRFALWQTGYRHRREIEEHLHNLPVDQMKVLLRFVESRKSSLPFDLYEGAVRDLEKRGILYQSSEVAHRMLDVYPFTITPEAMRFLRRSEFQKFLLSQRTD